MRILFLTEGTTVPASRFRVGQFIPHFEANGVECTIRPGYGDLYNRLLSTPMATPYKLATRLRRILKSWDVGRYDLVFLQRPAIPFTALPEVLHHKLNPRMILDVDDAFFVDADGSNNRRRMATFRTAVELSSRVICGNRHLVKVTDAPEKTHLIPTVIDAELYTPGDFDPSLKRPGPVIGWMGTSSNFISLRTVVEPILNFLEEDGRRVFRIVSNERFPDLADHPQVEEIRWSKEEEVDLLRSFDIGIMPLAKTASVLGKCGFKMIQYMAVGVPVVASPFGANSDIFEGSGAGHLADNDEEWFNALDQLVHSDQREAAAMNGRRHVEEKYCVRSVVPEYMAIFDELVRG